MSRARRNVPKIDGFALLFGAVLGAIVMIVAAIVRHFRKPPPRPAAAPPAHAPPAALPRRREPPRQAPAARVTPGMRGGRMTFNSMEEFEQWKRQSRTPK